MLPPAFTGLGLLGGALLYMLGYRRSAVGVFAGTGLLALAFSTPFVADLLVHPLEWEARESAQRAEPCCYHAIVILGGGVIPATPPAASSPHLVEGADRVWYAAQLFHKGLAPLIVTTGGRVGLPDERSGETDAQATTRLLIDLGVPRESIVEENDSRNTIQNIANLYPIVGRQPVALVTSGYHMPRALRLARKYGLEASAFPTDWFTPWAARASWENWVPGVEAETMSTIAIREYLAKFLDWREPE